MERVHSLGNYREPSKMTNPIDDRVITNIMMMIKSHKLVHFMIVNLYA
ncbi:MAG: hypothetical protein ACTSUE_19080 [Promethearchaeota archaeon]